MNDIAWNPRRFRPADPSDAPTVADLVDTAYRDYVPHIGITPGPMRYDYRQVIQDFDVTVAESDGTIAGVIVLRVADQGFLIDNVAVHPSYQGLGLGRALIEFGEARARQAGFDSVYLFTHEKMTGNLALYAKLGYAEYARRSEGDFSLVFLRKQLPDS